MHGRLIVIATLLLSLTACSWKNEQPSGGSSGTVGLPQVAHAPSLHPLLPNDPPPMPSPHLLTSIDSHDLLNITPAQAAPFLDIGHTSGGPKLNQSYAAAGIETIPYTDINHFIPGNGAGTNAYLSMSDVALTCDGQYVQWVKPNHPVTYLTDPRNPKTLRAWERWYTYFVSSGGSAWALYEDTADDPFSDAQPAPPCAKDGTGPVSQAEWTAAEEAQEGAMQAFSGKPVIFNGLAAGYSKQFPPQDALLDGPAAGGEAEACAPPSYAEWLDEMIIQIHALRNGKYFFCHGNLTTDGSTPEAIAYRQYQFATLMLDYDPALTVYESLWAVGPSNLKVQPESEVVMLKPSLPTINVPADLLMTGGVYARRYEKCYVAGALIGPCAAVVNPRGTAATYPFVAGKFNHTMVLQGSGIFDGATVSALGPAPGATLAPHSGEVVFP